MQAEQTWDHAPGVLHAVRRYWWVVVVGMLLGGPAGYGLANLQPTLYTATAEVLLTSPSSRGVLGDDVGSVDPTRNMLNQEQRMTSSAVLSETVRQLDGAVDVGTLQDSITVEASVDTDVLTIHATAPEADQAATIANSVIAAYDEVVREETMATARRSIEEIEETREQVQERLSRLERRLENDPDNNVLQRQADGLVAQIVTFDNRIEQISVNASLQGSGVEYVEPAVAPSSPSQPRPRRAAGAGGVFGALAGAAGAWLLDSRRRKADVRMDPAAVLSAPLLGSVPDLKAAGVGEFPSIDARHTPAAEAYQMIVLSLLASLPNDGSGNAVIITSAEPGEGKTVTAMNLAAAAQHEERDVLLVDGDARMRGLSRRCDLAGYAGLAEFHQNADSLVWWEYRHRPGRTGGVEVVPVGGELADPAGFFRSPKFTRMVQRMRDHADLVIIDSPPVLAVSDTLAVAKEVDGVVLVVSQGMSLDALAETRRRLSFLETPVLGYIFNRADTSAEPYGPYAYEAPAEASLPPTPDGGKT